MPTTPRNTPAPSDYSCCKCNNAFAHLRPADGRAFFPPRINDILFCSSCGTVNVMSLIGLREQTEEEFKSLSDEERSDLRHARKVIANHIARQ